MTRRLGTRPARGDEGIAMIIVMASISVFALLMAATMDYALAAMKQSRRGQDWNAALAAAQAGVDDYVARLNRNDAYWQAVDCTNPALQGPKAGSNGCGWTASTAAGWQQLVAGRPAQGAFHYDVDASAFYSQGVVRVTSTGKVRDVSRTIQVLVSRGGSTNYLYYTDFEDADPANQRAYPSGAPSDACGRSGPASARYWWSPGGRSGCVEITFVSGDQLDGKVHTNDTPLMTGTPTFRKGFETSDPACQTATAPGYAGCFRGTATPNLTGGKAQYVGPLYLPDTSSQFATYPGCQFTGDTRIRFNADGTMTVWSRLSAGTVVGTGCGDPVAYGSGSSQTVPVPSDRVIYVRNASSQTRCATGQVGDGLPIANDQNTGEATFYCGNGNAYVEGTLKGRVTLAAQNDVVVTGDLLLASTPRGAAPTGPDMLGLVASNSVVVYHPTSTSGTNLTTIQDRWVYASIQTLQHSFWVQSYNVGAGLGILHVRGSVAQKWRGIVGTNGTSTGFAKDYSYDTRLQFTSPPYFPDWTNAVWGAKTTGELKPAY
jgi:hypothetical protein